MDPASNALPLLRESYKKPYFIALNESTKMADQKIKTRKFIVLGSGKLVSRHSKKIY